MRAGISSRMVTSRKFRCRRTKNAGWSDYGGRRAWFTEWQKTAFCCEDLSSPSSSFPRFASTFLRFTQRLRCRYRRSPSVWHTTRARQGESAEQEKSAQVSHLPTKSKAGRILRRAQRAGQELPTAHRAGPLTAHWCPLPREPNVVLEEKYLGAAFMPYERH